MSIDLGLYDMYTLDYILNVVSILYKSLYL